MASTFSRVDLILMMINSIISPLYSVGGRKEPTMHQEVSGSGWMRQFAPSRFIAQHFVVPQFSMTSLLSKPPVLPRIQITFVIGLGATYTTHIKQ